MKRITKKLSSLAVACAMVVSLAGCGVSVTGVSFDIPDTLEKGSSIMATPEYAYDGETKFLKQNPRNIITQSI